MKCLRQTFRSYASTEAGSVAQRPEGAMKSQTDYLTLNMPTGSFVNQTPRVEEVVRKSGVREGLL
jgi:hypothetical protein